MGRLKIFICEDDKIQRKTIEKTINKIILNEHYEMEIILSTNDPHEVLNYVKCNKDRYLYFFDVNLGSDISGIELAKEIRKYDQDGYLIFITEKSELAHLTFKYKVNAFDYIEKDFISGVANRIYECMEKINMVDNTENKTQMFIVKNGGTSNHIKFEDILFFETSPTIHKIELHTLNDSIEFYGKLKEIEKSLDCRFYRCHKSYIVNKDNIKEIDYKNKDIKMINGEICPASTRLIRGLR